MEFSKQKKNKKHNVMEEIKAFKDNLKISDFLKNTKINNSFRLKSRKDSENVKDENIKEESDDSNKHNQVLAVERPRSIFYDSSLEFDLSPMIKVDALNDDTVHEYESDSEEEGEQPKSIVFNPAYESKLFDIPEISNQTPDNVEVDKTKPIEAVISSKDIKVKINIDDNIKLKTDENMNSKNITQLDTEDVLNGLPGTLPRMQKRLNRKLSLDQSILTRAASLSHSDVGLNLMGKIPLERKSTFLKKKLDSFVKNTSEVFKRQHSLIVKGEVDRRKVPFSHSLQSLNDTHMFTNNNPQNISCNKYHDSSLSLTNTDNTYSINQSLNNVNGSIENLRPLSLISDSSESLTSQRYYSVSSGLDSVKQPRKRSSLKTNRFSWLASERVSEYFRRISQNDESQKLLSDNEFNSDRRTSYQRAVSREDSARIKRKTSDTKNKPTNPRNQKSPLALMLDVYQANGIPELQGFTRTPMQPEAYEYIEYCSDPKNVEEIYKHLPLIDRQKCKQAVLVELITTEAAHIKHIEYIVNVYIATLHALQLEGFLGSVDTSLLFSNMPDVLNASLNFWQTTIFPMVAEARNEGQAPMNPLRMWDGFNNFRELLQPYEIFVYEQSKTAIYLRVQTTRDQDFKYYLNWCATRDSRNRLHLSDVMVKPMQRLTKYGLIMRRIAAHSSNKREAKAVLSMEKFARNFVLDVNRTISQREAFDRMAKMATAIDTIDIELDEDELHKFSQLHFNMNLDQPMANCSPEFKRIVFFEGLIKFRDSRSSNIEAYGILLTDMLLICKKVTQKNNTFKYKLLRQKYMVSKLLPRTVSAQDKIFNEELLFLVLDEYSTAYTWFALSDPYKDSNPSYMQMWDLKIREAQLAYDMCVWLGAHPNESLSTFKVTSLEKYESKCYWRSTEDNKIIEREAREKIAIVLHKPFHSGEHTDYDDEDELFLKNFKFSELEGDGIDHKDSTAQQSVASNQVLQVTPSTSTDPAFLFQPSVESGTSPQVSVSEPTSIMVNYEEAPIQPKLQKQSPMEETSNHQLTSRLNVQFLRVQPQCGVMALVHSLPDLSVNRRYREQPITGEMTAGKILYQTHNEMLARRRCLSPFRQSCGSSHLLSPEQRGISYPPPSPSRNLIRGLAISDSTKHPPLAKMGHVDSQSTSANEWSDASRLCSSQMEQKPSTSKQRGIGKKEEKKKEEKKKEEKHSKSLFKTGRSRSKN